MTSLAEEWLAIHSTWCGLATSAVPALAAESDLSAVVLARVEAREWGSAAARVSARARAASEGAS
jgi:hypothetical protein